MPPLVATVVFLVLIVGLLRMDRDGMSRTSPALWIPVAWMFIGGSRMASQWLGVNPLDAVDVTLEGSAFDRVVLTGLLAAGLIVLARRTERVGALLRDNKLIVAFFCYCAVSILWSDFPFVAFKRLTKGIGNLTMVLVILSDEHPAAAIKRFLAWSGFLLIPLSVLLIKYYPALGRIYNPWTWEAYFTGVSTDKNGLGGISMIVGLASLWRIVEECRQIRDSPSKGPLLAHSVILAMALWLFGKADSSTAVACFVLGAGLILITTRYVGSGPTRVHVIVAAVAVTVLLGVLFPNSYTYVVEALGRNTTLTGRTEIWDDLFRVDFSPLVGTGFESFWLGERADYMASRYYFHPNQAHNGYIEMYVNLGLIGVGFLVLLMASGYRQITAAYRENASLGPLRLALFTSAAVFNVTEATFKVMHPVWIVFLVVIAAPPAPDGADEDGTAI